MPLKFNGAPADNNDSDSTITLHFDDEDVVITIKVPKNLSGKDLENFLDGAITGAVAIVEYFIEEEEGDAE